MIKKYTFRVGMALAVCSSLAAGLANASKGNTSRKLSGCPAYEIIDSRGSGRPVGEISPPGRAFIARWHQIYPNEQTEVITNPYPAAGGPFGMVGAAFKIRFIGAYRSSVIDGSRWLSSKIRALNNICPSTKVLLVGYSQGAELTGETIQTIWPANVRGVILFGDPRYNHDDSSNRFAWNTVAKRRIRSKLDGSLSGRVPFNNESVLSFCHQEDPVCQAPLSARELAFFRLSQHENYTAFGEPKLAAEYFAKRVPPSVIRWPTTRHDALPSSVASYLAAAAINPLWDSCSDKFCLVGGSKMVYVFMLVDDKGPIGTYSLWVSDPSYALGYLGISPEDSAPLLTP